MAKIKTDIQCPNCGTKLDREHWGRTDHSIEYRYTCACGYNEHKIEHFENEKDLE